MTVKKALLLTGLAAIPLAAYSYYEYSYNNFSVTPIGAKINGINNGVLNVSLQFKVSSKAGISFTIETCEVNIYLNDQLLGIANSPNVVKVPGNGEGILNVYGNFDSARLGSAISSFLFGFLTGNQKKVLHVVGQCTVRINLPLLNTFTVKVPVDELMEI